MHNFKDIEFPETDGDNVLKSIGISDSDHIELFTKFMESAKGRNSKSRVIEKIMSNNEFTDAEMKLIFLLAYDRATAIITENAEREFSKS